MVESPWLDIGFDGGNDYQVISTPKGEEWVGRPGIWIRKPTEEEPKPEPQHTYSVRILHRMEAEDWHWHPYVMTRVADFCQNYEAQADPQELVRNLQQSFVIDDPGLIVLAFFMDDTLIGHMLADRAILYYRPIVTVHQYALDHGIPPEIRHEAIRLVKEWAKDPGPDGTREPAEFIQWLIRDKRLVPMYKRFFKAKAHLLLMRTEVED